MEPQPDLTQPLRAVLESTGTSFETATYRQGSRIFSQGDDARNVLHLEHGRVWLAVTTPNGKEAICDLVDSGSFIGEEILAGQTTRPHTATAMLATEVLILAREHMVRLLRTEPAVAGSFIKHSLDRSIRLQTELADQLLYPCEERLAHTLLMLAGCDARHRSSCALPRVSQEMIAEMVGTTRSRVSLFMTRFKKSGLLREENGVLHINGPLLRRVHHERGNLRLQS
jgi:CRP-like cAMP-binding protein